MSCSDNIQCPSTLAQMIDELMIAFLASLVFSCVVFFPLKLSGLWVLFWMTYYCTLSIGIGEPSARAVTRCMAGSHSTSSLAPEHVLLDPLHLSSSSGMILYPPRRCVSS